MTDGQTRFTIMTPPGVGAVATCAIFGPDAWNVCRTLIRRLNKLPLSNDIDESQILMGEVGAPPGETVMLVARRVRGMPLAEIHCHGGYQSIQRLAREFASLGVIQSTVELMLSALGTGCTRVLAAQQLALATTQKTAAILLDQYHGACDRAISSIAISLDDRNFAQAQSQISALHSFCGIGRHLVAPWRVVVAGVPNVGKSSLVNSIAGFQRSVVAPTPGTTRDLVSTITAIDGWPIELIDTAGQHATSDLIEERGIARARTALGQADLVLWVVDSISQPIWPQIAQINWLPVVNKLDLPATWAIGEFPHPIQVSAQTAAGIDELCQRISTALVPNPPAPGDAIPFTPEMADRMESVAKALAMGNTEAVRSELNAMLECRSSGPDHSTCRDES